jgi:hypothetical protein
LRLGLMGIELDSHGPRDPAELFVKSVEVSKIGHEYGMPFQVFYGVSANSRSAWSVANASRIIGYEPQDDSEVVYADEIRELMLEPARQNMVQGQDWGGKDSR